MSFTRRDSGVSDGAVSTGIGRIVKCRSPPWRSLDGSWEPCLQLQSAYLELGLPLPLLYALFYIAIAIMADHQSPPTDGGRPKVSPSHPENDPAKTGYDPSARWTNYYNILTDKMTREGQEAFREDAYIRNEARDVKNAEEWRDYLFQYSPIIRFLNGKIRDLNGNLDASNVHCKRCPTRIVEVPETKEDGTTEMVKRKVRQGGGFSPDHGILICANEMRNQGHLEDTLAHEMVHAWDHLRWKVDWSDLRHAACTEVSSLSLIRIFLPCLSWPLLLSPSNCIMANSH